MLIGKKVVVRPLEYDELEIVYRWYQDPDVRYWSSGNHPECLYSKYELEEMYEREIRNESVRRWMIETVDGLPIGVIMYKGIDKQVRSTVLGISLGEKAYWGKGYGTDALRTMLVFLFEQCNLNRVELNTFDTNHRALHVYEKCGFQVEGRVREGFYISGEYRDKIIMGILKRDFDQMKHTW